MRIVESLGSGTTLGAQSLLGVYRFVLCPRVGQQLRSSPPDLQGHFAGITALLRVDPTAASAMLQIQQTDTDVWTATYGEGRGFLQYRVVEAQRLVVVLEWVWIS